MRAFKFAHAKSKYSSRRSVDNGEKIDSSEAAIFTNRVAALLYLHLPLMARPINGKYAGNDYIALPSRRIPQSRVPDAIARARYQTDLKSDIVEATLIYSAALT